MSGPLYRHDEVPSTLDLLHRLAEAGAPEGTAVVARVQTAGRGSRGRTWYSPEGGLWLSWLARPSSPIGGEVLSLRVGLAIAATLEQMGDLPPIALKWPNDVMVGGKKVAGILCEARWQGGEPGWIAVGIGMNVRNRVPDEVRATATSLANFCGDVSPDSVLGVLLPELDAIASRPGALSAAELGSFGDRDWLRGRALAEPVAGVAEGITAAGSLQVRTTAGTRREVRSGHVVLAD